MCFGGGQQPSAPEVKYVGPSDSDIRRNEQQLATFQSQMQEQQAATAAGIQSQIDAANAQTEKLQAQYDKELAAADADASAAEKAAMEAAEMAKAAGASFTPVGAYGVTASQTEAPAAQTTTAIKQKKKAKGSLKISPSAVAQAGSGLNIGV